MGKRHKPEEIIAKLRQVEMYDRSGHVGGGRDPFDWGDGSDLPPLWTALPLQTDFGLRSFGALVAVQRASHAGPSRRSFFPTTPLIIYG